MRRHVMKLPIALLFVVGFLTPQRLSAEPAALCFNVPGIDSCISGRFREYWEQNGGLAVFGYPITAANQEVNRDTGQSYLTQWFERNRFEYHADKAAPYDVLLGRVGAGQLQKQGIDWTTQARATSSAGDCLHFAETGHDVCDQANGLGFKSYWQGHGLQDNQLDGYQQSLALFGLPLTEARTEKNEQGETVLTQWFERARFEWHPDKPDQFKVLLGLITETGSDAPQARADCKVQHIERFSPDGGGVEWSHTGNNYVLLTAYDSNKIKQVFRLNADGSGKTCLTCTEVPGGPPASVNKGFASWHPAGQFIVVQVEMAQHPLQGKLGDPGSGWFNDIWAMTPDGSRWWQLTNYGSDKVHGVLIPRISPDGNKLAWAELYKGPDKAAASLGAGQGDPFGRWHLDIADLVVDAQGPHLANIQSSNPGDGNFYEMQDWSPDGQTVMFAADIGRSNAYTLDVWTMDVASGTLTPMSNTDDSWEEHATFSRSGHKITLMSSECCQWDPTKVGTLEAELYLIDADGSHKVQLTHFNTPGYAETTGYRTVATKATWSPDGTQLIVGDILLSAGYSQGNKHTESWRVTFQGACGTD